MSRHIATDYTDTTPGAIHKYYDENGEFVLHSFISMSIPDDLKFTTIIEDQLPNHILLLMYVAAPIL